MSAPVISATTANMNFNAGNNKPYVKEMITWGPLILLQEAKDFCLADFLPDNWRSLQNTGSESKAGACIGFDTDILKCVDHWLVKGCSPPPDGGMLARWIQVAAMEYRGSGKQFTAIAAHVPPDRYPHEQDVFVETLAGVRADNTKPLIGTDANMPITELARRVGNVQGFGFGIVGHLTNMRVHKVTRRGWAEEHNASDHPGVTAKVELVKAG